MLRYLLSNKKRHTSQGCRRRACSERARSAFPIFPIGVPANLEQNSTTGTVEATRKHQTDTGSTAVQIALLTERINGLAGHFRTNVHDHSGRRGLLKMVGQRRRLLRYLHREDVKSYQALVDRLGLRK